MQWGIRALHRIFASERNTLEVGKVARAVLMTSWCVVTAAIISQSIGILNVVGLLELAGGRICHHDPARSFSGSEGTWAVCARCSGLYAGWLVLAPAWWLSMRHGSSRNLLIALALLFGGAAVAALVERSALFVGSNELRFVLGVPLGLFPSALFAFGAERLKNIPDPHPIEP